MSDGHYLERAEDLIYIGQPDLTADEQEAVLGVLRRGWLTRGPECAAFEKEFCESVQASQALMVSSCTAALHLALLVQDIGPGMRSSCPR
ncbi:MAG: DegT/DnrJ/EryC1/StrS aminotransferase family protein [Candidatus Omnitrophica bacterium]|nr:DegT/DnrJ/EryC1/StrS aminotransferase family protein [Candidatus Omnitrophota bacterium]